MADQGVSEDGVDQIKDGCRMKDQGMARDGVDQTRQGWWAAAARLHLHSSASTT